ncbi:MAG: hypothetical protein VX672_03055 [Planctomycetota bacterium]|nr:hypothetical protein [Planctomycetota bacterium]
MIVLLAPLIGLLAAAVAGILAVGSPEAVWSGPTLTGAIAGGIVCVALLGLGGLREHLLTGRPPAPTGGTTPAGLDDRLQRIEEHVMLSDGAKRLLYRDRELELVRMMLEQDVAAGDHDAALRLVDELAAQVGRLEEAENHRTRIDSLRRAAVDRRIAEGMQTIRRLLAGNDWKAATRAADRLHRLLPDAPGLEDLGNQITSARTRHSIEVETRMRDAHAEGRIDDAMALLRELDRHLIRGESSRVVDVAQAIIVAHRDLMGRRFRAAVSEKAWADSVGLGEAIARDYPNTRMAEEVAEMMPTLRQRAGAALGNAQSPLPATRASGAAGVKPGE